VDRLPSRDQVISQFASCVFLVYTWTIFSFLYKLPGWLMFLNLSEVLGVFSYALASALVESLLILLFLVALAVLLPKPWFGDRFVAQGTVLAVVLSFWSVVFQFIYASTPRWDTSKMLLWFLLLLLSTPIAGFLVHRLERFGGLVNAFADRLTLFLYVYVPMGLLGLAIVAVRNLP
jgi:hypothetical protein